MRTNASPSFSCLIVLLALAMPCLAEEAGLPKELEAVKEQLEELGEHLEKDPLNRSVEAIRKLGIQPQELEMAWQVAAKEHRNRCLCAAITKGIWGIGLAVAAFFSIMGLWRFLKTVSGLTNTRPVWLQNGDSPATVGGLVILVVIAVITVIVSGFCLCDACDRAGASLAPNVDLAESLLRKVK